MDLVALQKARRDRLAALKSKSKAISLVLFHQPAVGAVDLLKTGRFSDFTIVCGDMSFKVHKAHVYMQSAYFKSLIESGFQEASENMVNIEEAEPLTMAMLLLLMYVGNVGQYLDQVYQVFPTLSPPVFKGNSEEDKKSYLNDHFELELKTMINVYALADRLLIGHVAKATAVYVTKYLEACLFEKLKPEVPGPDSQDLTSVLTHIYTTTGFDDISLREETTLICHRSQHRLLALPTAMRTIEQYDGRAWRMGNRIAMNIREKHDAIVSATETETRRNARSVDKTVLVEVMKKNLWNLVGL